MAHPGQKPHKKMKGWTKLTDAELQAAFAYEMYIRDAQELYQNLVVVLTKTKKEGKALEKKGKVSFDSKEWCQRKADEVNQRIATVVGNRV